ncbi:g3371 [Coccomyxa elongata]
MPSLGQHTCNPLRTHNTFQRICSTSGRPLIPQESPFPLRGRPQVLKASERFEQGLDAPSLSDFFDGQMAQMQRSFIEMEREMDREVSRINERARKLQERGKVTGFSQRQEGAQTYRNEQQWEEKLPGGWRKGYRSESITYFGAPTSAPIQLQSAQSAGLGNGVTLFALATLIGAYTAVAAALMQSYKHTKYSASKAWLVVAAWPLLALFSDRFRQEIRTALRRKTLFKDNGKDDGVVL